MFTAIQDNKRISIEDYVQGDVFCPVCNEKLIIKRGDINAHHFSHKVTSDCDTWYEMSEWHKSMQEMFPIQYREVVLSKDGKKHRADIKVKNLLIEFQKSSISVRDIAERTNFYKDFGTLVWVFKIPEDLNIDSYNNILVWSRARKSILSLINGKNYVYLAFDDIVVRIDNMIGKIHLYENYSSIIKGIATTQKIMTYSEFMDELRLLYKGVDLQRITKSQSLEKWNATNGKKYWIKSFGSIDVRGNYFSIK